MNINIPGYLNSSKVAYGRDTIGTIPNMWQSNPGQNPRFAEFSNSIANTDEQIDDTGVSFTAFLPFSTSRDRETLRNYTGPATVFDTGVVCTPANITFSAVYDADQSGSAIAGNLTLDGTSPSSEPEPFYCLLPMSDPMYNLMWNISVCFISEFDRYYTFLVFNTTAPSILNWILETNNSLDSPLMNFRPDSFFFSTEGPWPTAILTNNTDIEISVTSCRSALSANRDPSSSGPIDGYVYNISATSQNDGPEPSLAWPGTLQTELELGDTSDIYLSYDTENVRRQLGVLPEYQLPDERGLMALDYQYTFWEGLIHSLPTTGVLVNGTFGEASTYPSALMIRGKCLDSGQQFSQSGNQAHVSLFHDTLRTTRSPAKALKGWFMTLVQQAYFDELPRFTVGSPATYMNSLIVQVPARWVGFVIVLAMTAIHLLLVTGTTVWYLCSTRFTMLGNSWQAVAQITSDETMPLLVQATDMKDREVMALIHRGPAAGKKYKLAKHWTTGREELSAIEKPPLN